MPRDERAYLADIVEACDAILLAVRSDALVWAIIQKDIPVLRQQCATLLGSAGAVPG